jgi:O-antigen/teichoic acid export membrane protein
VIKSIFQTSATNIFITLLNVITGILLARLLGPEQRGELAAAQMLPGMISSLALLGLPQAIIYWISRDKNNSKQTVVTTLLFYIPVSILGYIFGYFLMPFVLAAQSEQVVHTAQIYMLVIFYSALSSLYVGGLQGLNNFKYWNLMRTFPYGMWLFAILSGYAMGSLSPAYLLIFMLVFPFPFAILFMYYFWKKLEGELSFSLKHLQELLRYGLPVSLTAIPQTINLRLDQLLMAAFLTPGLLGLYTIGVTWSSASSVILSAFGSVITPNLASLGDDEIRRGQIVGITTRGSIVLVLLMIIAQVLVTPIFIPLIFGKSYLPAIPAAVILVVAGGVTNLGSLWRSILYGLGDVKSVFFAEVMGLIITLVALAVLLAPYQIVGAAVASLLSYFVTLIYLTMIIGRRMKISLRYLLLPSYSDVVWAGAKIADLIQKAKTKQSY